MQAELIDMIRLKNEPVPFRYHKTPILLEDDRATFPFRRYWRGNYESPWPIIYGRRAGFRARREDFVPPTTSPQNYVMPCLFFETAPYTKFPCYDEPFGQYGQSCVCTYGSR